MKKVILAGDIGGTKTALALYSQDNGLSTPLIIQQYHSSSYPNLEEIIFTFMKDSKESVAFACFDVAGPVLNNQAKVTNLPWLIDSHSLSQALDNAPVALINDLFAIASAIPHLQSNDFEVIKPGETIEHGTIGVVAPGTGLGEAFLAWTEKEYLAFPSEGGHTDFSPQTNEEIALLKYLLERYDHVSFERVCSGIGIPHLYHFLRDIQLIEEPEWLNSKLRASDDPTAIIIQTAQNSETEICRKTLQLFITILASEAGNLALKILATGGIYLAGGLSRHLREELKNNVFSERFIQKGRLSPFLTRVPVYNILNPNVALLGAASIAIKYGQENKTV